MTKDPLYQAELAHDCGVDAEPFMREALDCLIDDLMVGLKPKGLGWGLQDFLEDQEDLAELVSAALITCEYSVLDAEIERRLRQELEDHDIIHDLAVQFASGEKAI